MVYPSLLHPFFTSIAQRPQRSNCVFTRYSISSFGQVSSLLIPEIYTSRGKHLDYSFPKNKLHEERLQKNVRPVLWFGCFIFQSKYFLVITAPLLVLLLERRITHDFHMNLPTPADSLLPSWRKRLERRKLMYPSLSILYSCQTPPLPRKESRNRRKNYRSWWTMYVPGAQLHLRHPTFQGPRGMAGSRGGSPQKAPAFGVHTPVRLGYSHNTTHFTLDFPSQNARTVLGGVLDDSMWVCPLRSLGE